MNSLNPLTIGSIEHSNVEAPETKSGSSAEVQEELQRILASPQFEASDRNRRFFTYVVEETLAGRGERIKAYNIATMVFGRDDTFDPQLDPVVRMEARRLRRSLERFYLVEGAANAVRIAIPKGSYMPKFLNAAVAQRAANSHAHDLTQESAPALPTVSIVVLAFEIEDDWRTYKNHGEALSRQIAVGLSRFPEIAVFTQRANFGRSVSDDLRPSVGEPRIGLVLGGNGILVRNTLRVTVTLASERTGRVVWGETFEQDIVDKGVLQARESIANRIVRSLIQSFGEIFTDKIELDSKGSQCASFESLVRFYQYRRYVQNDLFSVARHSLERVVTAIQDSETTACLSQIYSDGHRFGFAAESPTKLRFQATELARKSIELAPDSSRGHHALGIALWFSGDVDSSLEMLHRALVLNPNATEALADLGFLLCLRGEWAEGIALINDAYSGNPGNSGLQRLGLSLYQFVNGQFEQALAEAKRIRARDVTYGFAAQAISLVRLGRKEDAAAAIACIRAINPNCHRDLLEDLGGSSIQTAIADEIRLALHDAGVATVHRTIR